MERIEKRDFVLRNRYGYTNTLVYQGGSHPEVWMVYFDKTMHHCRYIFGPDNTTITAFDPEGGPYLSVGDELSIGTIQSIYEQNDRLLLTIQ